MMNRAAPWFPRVLGATALVMALWAFFDWAVVPPEKLIGPSAGWASLPNFVLLLWASWGCFRRWRIMPVAVVGYVVCLIVAMWVWTVVYERDRFVSLRTPILVDGVVTAMLLAFCRATWQRRAAFTR